MLPLAVRRSSKLQIVCLVALLGGLTRAEEPGAAPAATQLHRLAFRFESGERVTHEITHDSRITSAQGGRREVAINKTRTFRTYRVIEVPPAGGAVLEMQLDAVWMSAEFEDEDGTQGPAVVFDSRDPESAKNPKFNQVRENIGQPQALLTVDSTGRTLEVKQRSKKENEEKEPGSKQRPDNFLLTLPKEPVAVGATWKDPFDVLVRNEASLLVRIRMQTTYRLEEVAGDLATITYRTVVLTPVEQPTIAAQLIQRELEGKAVFDMSRGRLVSREAKLDRTVVGAFGPQSTMQASARYKEVPSSAETAAREKNPVK